MTESDVAQVFGSGLWLVVLMVAVIVLPSLFVGLVVSVFQAATQINEQTLSFLPRLLATLVTILICGPWIIGKLTDHMNNLMSEIPFLIG